MKMTAEERAAVVMDETKRAGHRYVDEGGMREAIVAAIRAAVDAERERCARVCREYAAGAGIVNDAEGYPVCPHCNGESIADELADRILAVPS